MKIRKISNQQFNFTTQGTGRKKKEKKQTQSQKKETENITTEINEIKNRKTKKNQ